MERSRGFPRSAVKFTVPNPNLLRHKVEIYIPSNNWKDQAVVKLVFKKFCEVFGGATMVMVKGGRIDAEGELIEDNIAIIRSFVKSIDSSVRRVVRQQAYQVQVALDQDMVTIVTDNVCQFIEREVSETI